MRDLFTEPGVAPCTSTIYFSSILPKFQRPNIRRIFLLPLSNRLSGLPTVSRLMANFVIDSGTRHTQDVPAGKYPRSPGPNRRSLSPSMVMKASPEITKSVSSEWYCHLNCPAVHSQTTIVESRSELLSRRLVRVSGLPACIQSGEIGGVWIPSSTLLGVTITID